MNKYTYSGGLVFFAYFFRFFSYFFPFPGLGDLLASPLCGGGTEPCHHGTEAKVDPKYLALRQVYGRYPPNNDLAPGTQRHEKNCRQLQPNFVAAAALMRYFISLRRGRQRLPQCPSCRIVTKHGSVTAA